VNRESEGESEVPDAAFFEELRFGCAPDSGDLDDRDSQARHRAIESIDLMMAILRWGDCGLTMLWAQGPIC
jgi:hypothetical protein